MAVLTFPGAEAILAVQAAALPQPDQLCGPFVAHAALHAVLEAADVPTLTRIAAASGSAIWPHDVSGWRPPGARFDRTGWDHLPAAEAIEEAGTDAAGLAGGIVEVTRGAAAVVPVAGAGADAESVRRVMVALAEAEVPVGVVANVWTGAFGFGPDWEVGHFVLVWAVDDQGQGRVAIADTYAELGAAGEPPGCQWVGVDRLAASIAAPPGRGLLLVTAPNASPSIIAMVTAAGLDATIWST